LARKSEYHEWLEAHIEMQRDLLKGLPKDEKRFREGHIALLEQKLGEVRRMR
jgi:hypothetical protein